MTERRVGVRVTGVVQGVGFRPFVFAHATRLGLRGHVGNDAGGVFVDAQGAPPAIDELLEALRQGPPMAAVASVDAADLALGGAPGFVIAASVASPGTTSIPPDTAVCDDCLAEMRDPADRRFGYPFIACTNCGPRYTIVTGLPYDRPQTTMVDFPLCSDCQVEYDDPRSRRFHAQPTACPACGPSYDTSVAAIVSALSSGAIVAIKGIGGYHLACNARDARAVERLRARKARGAKPFALMARDLDVVGTLVQVDAPTASALASPARPVVLAPSLDAALQASVAPGNGYLGVMLPYAPIHHLLFDSGAPDVLVMTSGNVSDEPICTTADEAATRLAGMADVLVHHDRRIHVACDDSVLRAAGGLLQPVRRSRGYAPLPIRLPVASPGLIAVGGELKTTACVADGNTAWMSQHVGDTENLETLAMLGRVVSALTILQRVIPTAIVSDAHPAYLSRRWAQEEAVRRGVPHLTVQHHHAHLASLLAEHGWPAGQPVLGFAFDGTGYGTDGTIWGGEVLLGSYPSVERVGHLRPILLPGGDAAIRRPLRSALAHLFAAGVDVDPALSLVDAAEPHELEVVGRLLATGTACTPTTSVGRLFDAVASLLGVRHSVDYEGQAAIELEALAAGQSGPAADVSWRLGVEPQGPDGLVLDAAPAVRAAVASVRAGHPTARAAWSFHDALAEAVSRVAVAVRERTSVGTVGLTGGVFSNTLLTSLTQDRLAREGFTVLVHRQVPPNDGGLALGQVAVAAAGGARIEGR